MTEKHKEYLDSISEIKNMMDRSSRFISLSGLSGIFAGIWALCGAAFAYTILHSISYPYKVDILDTKNALFLLLADAIIVLILAISSGIYFTVRKAKKEGNTIWDKKTITLLWNLVVPLSVAGLFCLVLIYHGLFVFVPGAALILYGLALFNAGNYTHRDVKHLGLVEITLGFINFMFLGYGLYFWAVGFGVLHIIYGIIMYYKHERKGK